MTTEPFREDIRYEYDLTPDSVVLDCGGYEGTFAEEISKRFGCFVHVLEPVRLFYERTSERLKEWPKVCVHRFGISGACGAAKFGIKGSMTGKYTGSDSWECAYVITPEMALALAMRESPHVDLIKLNVEGSEFDVIEDMLSRNVAHRFRNIQVQWHGVVPDAENRRNAIMEGLAREHELTFDYGWTWQNWRIKA